jgi:hypothetical protein
MDLVDRFIYLLLAALAALVACSYCGWTWTVLGVSFDSFFYALFAFLCLAIAALVYISISAGGLE